MHLGCRRRRFAALSSPKDADALRRAWGAQTTRQKEQQDEEVERFFGGGWGGGMLGIYRLCRGSRGGGGARVGPGVGFGSRRRRERRRERRRDLLLCRALPRCGHP